MDIKRLKIFLALAENLHFGKASAECHISLSALSRNIRQLEEKLGVTLFTRDNRSVQITLQGQAFVSYAPAQLSANGGLLLAKCKMHMISYKVK